MPDIRTALALAALIAGISGCASHGPGGNAYSTNDAAPAVGAVAIGMVLGPPAAANGYGFRAGKLDDRRLHIGPLVGTVAERQILAAGAATVGDTF